MNIIHIITQLELGGAQLNTLATCRHLQAREHEVHLLSGNGPDSKVEARTDLLPSLSAEGGCTNYGIFGLTNGSTWWLAPYALYEIWNLLRYHKPYIVHTHSTKAGILGRLAAWLAGVPKIVHTVHGWGHHGLTGWRRWLLVCLERILATRTDALVFVSKADMRWAFEQEIGHCCVREDKAGDRYLGWWDRRVLIRSGIRTELFSTSGKAPERPRNIVLTVSNGKPQKRPEDFSNLAWKIKCGYPEWNFWSVGSAHGVREPSYVNYSGQLSQAELAALMRRCSIFVLTSGWEGLPRSLLEAMAAGLPCLAYDVGGISEILPAGCLVPVGEVELLAHKVGFLIEHPELRAKLGAENSARVTYEWSEEKMLSDLDSLYRGLDVLPPSC